MLYIEVRGGVAVSAYADKMSKIIVIDYDNNEAGYLPVDPTSSIPDYALNLIDELARKTRR